MVQKDLAEYTCTMSADTSKAVATTSDKIKESLKVAKFLDMTILNLSWFVYMCTGSQLTYNV